MATGTRTRVLFLTSLLSSALCASTVFAQVEVSRPTSPRGQPATATVPATSPVANTTSQDDGTADRTTMDAESNQRLETMLPQLRTNSPEAREHAVAALMTLGPSDVPAIRARLLAVLPMSHFDVHAAMVEAVKPITNGRDDVEFDLLDALVHAPRRTPAMDTATERIALARVLGKLHTTDAGRAILSFGMSHHSIFRKEVHRIIKKSIKEYILPALIEYRLPSEEAKRFIREAREGIRKVTPGESVQVRDNALLAEILHAYGTTRQPDAIAVVVSFVNSERSQVRDASRATVELYGSLSVNALRQAYESYVGSKPPDPTWTWKRIASELYEASDRRRDEEVAARLDEGLAAAKAGRFDEMMTRFEYVLARHPLYTRCAEMVPWLLRWARRLEQREAARAEQIYRLALHIDPAGPHAKQIHSAIYFIEAERALAHGVADPELYRLAVTEDPNNQRARTQFDTVVQREITTARRRKRMMAAMGLLALALASAGFFFLRARSIARARERARSRTGRTRRSSTATGSISGTATSSAGVSVGA